MNTDGAVSFNPFASPAATVPGGDSSAGGGAASTTQTTSQPTTSSGTSSVPSAGQLTTPTVGTGQPLNVEPTEGQQQTQQQGQQNGQRQQQGAASGTQQGGQHQQQNGQINLTPEAMAQLLATLNQNNGQQQQQQQNGQRQQNNDDPDAGLTPEQIDAKYNVVKVNEADIQKVFRGGPEGVQALQTLLHQAAKMGATIASYHVLPQVERALGQLNGRFQPAAEMAQRTEQQRHYDAFFKEYNGFDPNTHGALLTAVYKNLEASGFRGTPEQVYAKIAADAAAMLQTVVPGFQIKRQQANGTQQQTGSAAQTNTQQQQTNLPQSQMTQVTMTSGSGGGSVAQGAQSEASATAKSIFGRM